MAWTEKLLDGVGSSAIPDLAIPDVAIPDTDPWLIKPLPSN